MNCFLRFVRLEIEQRFIRKRWLLPIPVMLFTTYITLGTLMAQVSNVHVIINAWDGLFSVFANQNVVFFVLTFLFLYLVSDLMSEGSLGQAVLLRFGSRRGWWLSKVMLLGIAVLFYLGISVGIAAGVATFVLPWQTAWSPGARQFPEMVYVQSDAMALAPGIAFAELALLLGLGWFVLGLVVLVAVQLFKRASIGLLAGLVVVIAGMAAQRADLPPPWSCIFIHQHLLYNLHSFGETALPYTALWLSVMYWLVCGAGLVGLGLYLSQRQDFFAEAVRG